MRDSISHLWHLMHGQRARYIKAFAAMVIAVGLSFLVPLVVRATLDSAIGGQPTPIPPWLRWGAPTWRALTDPGIPLWRPAALTVGLTLVAGLFMYAQSRWTAKAAESMARRLRDRLYRHIQSLPASYHAGAQTGDLVQRCSSDVEIVRTFLAGQLLQIALAGVMIAVAAPIMFAINWRLTSLALMFVPVLIAFSVFYFRRIRQTFRKVQRAEAAMTTVIQENLTGIRVVRAFARQDYETTVFGKRNRRFRDRRRQLIRLMALYWAVSDLLCLAPTTLVILLGAAWAAQGRLSVGSLYAFSSYLMMMMMPVRQLGRILSDMGQTFVSVERLREVLDAPPEADPPEDTRVELPPTTEGRLVFKNVGFAYEPGHDVLSDVSFTIEPGQAVALIGPTGSGKSTIVNLLLRLYDYDRGSITLDGCELTHLRRADVRARVGAVLQEPFLFSKTVGENIQIGRADAQHHEVVDAAMVACVHEAIDQFDQGYDTVVGERGVTLSGGQRQRVALARTLLRNSPILVLDDALSAVDTQTERMILEAMRRRHGRLTTLVIAHRLSTLQHADLMIVLDRGRVAQIGPHDELIAREGLYRRLWQIQGDLKRDIHEPQDTGP